VFPNLFRGLFLVAALAVLALVALVLLMSQDRRGRQKLPGSDAEPAQNFGNDHPYGALVVHVSAMLGAAYAGRRRDPLVAQSRLELQAQHFFDLAPRAHAVTETSVTDPLPWLMINR
jgi:hypothetical protein